jgi:ABC-type transport system involved in multi-copper enzyme maturation permease subunit
VYCHRVTTQLQLINISYICMTDANSNIRLREGDDHFRSIFFIVKETVNNEITVCIIYVYVLILLHYVIFSSRDI